MLFVLRLLPPDRKWQERIILFVLFLNFAITMIATVSYGVRCQPYIAAYEYIPGATCFSNRVLVITMQLNASKAFESKQRAAN